MRRIRRERPLGEEMRREPYHSFWNRIHESAAERGFPLRVMFELTYRCNFKCAHCYVPADYTKRYRKKELKKKEVFSILDELKRMGCFYLGFTGGEPFLRKDFMDILRHAKKHGFEIIIYTNGSLINQETARELKRINPNKVDITIPAITRKAFEHISGVAGSREKVFRAVGFLHKEGINLGFKTCVLKDNESEIGRIRDFAASLNAPHRLDDKLDPRLDGSKEPYKYRAGNILKSKMQNPKSKDCVKESADKKQTTGNLFKCGAGKTQAAITPAGELKMCVMMDYPKYRILRSSLKRCWDKLKALSGSIVPDKNYKCDMCELEPYCNRCPASSWLFDGTFTNCDPESRLWAEERKRCLIRK